MINSKKFPNLHGDSLSSNMKFNSEGVCLLDLTLHQPCETERSHLAASPARRHPSNSGWVCLNLHQSIDTINYSTIH